MEGSIGPRGAAVVPLAVTLFVFILIANWFSVLGVGSEIEWLGRAHERHQPDRWPWRSS